MKNGPSRTAPDQAAIDLATSDEEKLFGGNRTSSTKGSVAGPQSVSVMASPSGKSKLQRRRIILPHLNTRGLAVDDSFRDPFEQMEEENGHQTLEGRRRVYSRELADMDVDPSAVRRQFRYPLPVTPARSGEEAARERARVAAEEKRLERLYEAKEQ